VRGSLRVGRHGTTEAIELDLLVGVVVLEDGAHGLHDLQILVLPRVEIMQRFRVVGRPIGQGEVNRDGEVNFTAAKHVL